MNRLVRTLTSTGLVCVGLMAAFAAVPARAEDDAVVTGGQSRRSCAGERR